MKKTFQRGNGLMNKIENKIGRKTTIIMVNLIKIINTKRIIINKVTSKGMLEVTIEIMEMDLVAVAMERNSIIKKGKIEIITIFHVTVNILIEKLFVT